MPTAANGGKRERRDARRSQTEPERKGFGNDLDAHFFSVSGKAL